MISNKPAKLFEYLPNNVFPILFPIETPIEIEIIENNPIDNEAYSGGIPVIPAPNPIVKQLSPSKPPRRIDSFHPISFILLGNLFFEVQIINKPRQTIKNPPTKFAVEFER